MFIIRRRALACAIAAVCGAVLFLSGMLIGKELHESGAAAEPPQNAADAKDGANAHSVDSIGEESVLPTTRVEWEYSFSLCPHEHIATGGASLIGMTRADIEKAYPEHEIAEFTKMRVRLSRTTEGFCPKHFLLKLENGGLVVYRTDEVTLLPTEYKRIASKFDAPEGADEELIRGILFDSEKEINEYIESIES